MTPEGKAGLLPREGNSVSKTLQSFDDFWLGTKAEEIERKSRRAVYYVCAARGQGNRNHEENIFLKEVAKVTMVSKKQG